MLFVLFMVRSVNLSEIAVAMDAKATIESRYKRVRRFFLNLSLILPVYLDRFILFFH